MNDKDAELSKKNPDKNEEDIKKLLTQIMEKLDEVENNKFDELNKEMGGFKPLFSGSCLSFHSSGVGEHRKVRIVKGESGSEVSKVIKVMQNDMEKKFGSINISNSTIGMLNTGEIENVNSISLNVSTLMDSGKKKVAFALKNLTESVTSNQNISLDQRTEFLDQLEEISRQATLSPEKRAKIGVIKAIITNLAKSFEAVGGLAEVWSTWGRSICNFFGL